MILKKIKMGNFRGYKEIIVEFDKDMNVIIGRNDVGKSTILEALEIFFNSEKYKIEVSDLCVFGDSSKIEITCCFDVGDGSILVDSSNYSTCSDEFLLNEEGLLEIRKEWDCIGDTITKSRSKIYIRSLYPINYKTPLLLEKISGLQKIYDKYKDDPVYEPENRSKSAELRKAIYAKELKEPIEKISTDIDISKEDAKQIWESISKQLPMYFLFESDRKNTDKDSEIQDPLKAVTKSVLADLLPEIEAMQAQVKQKVEEIGEKTISKLAELDESIAKDIRPVVSLKPIDSSFVFDLVADNNIPLNKRGSGIRRLILLSYFRADAEESHIANNGRQMIYAIEEPETGQHPDFQRMILETFLEISQKSTHQIIITSHTPEIVKLVELDQLIFLKKDENGLTKKEDNKDLKARDIAKTLGILPYAATRPVIYVEGLNDVNFLGNINKNIPELNSIIDLESEGISIIPLAGSRLIDWINKDYFHETPVLEIYMADNDVEKYSKLIGEINSKNDGKRFGWCTNLSEMENYIPPELIEEEFNVDLSSFKADWNKLDISKILIDRCLETISEVKEREKIIKMKLNGSLTKKITKEMLVQQGTWSEVEKWFKDIKSVNETGSREVIAHAVGK